MDRNPSMFKPFLSLIYFWNSESPFWTKKTVKSQFAFSLFSKKVECTLGSQLKKFVIACSSRIEPRFLTWKLGNLTLRVLEKKGADFRNVKKMLNPKMREVNIELFHYWQKEQKVVVYNAFGAKFLAQFPESSK